MLYDGGNLRDGLRPCTSPLYCSWFFLQIFCSVHVCGKDVAFVSIVTTTASCKLITTGFIVFVVHRVIESSLLLLVFCSRTEMWRRKRRRSCRSSSSLNAGIFTIHRRSTMLSYESYQATNLWQLNGLMFYISIHPVDRVLSDVYYPSSFIMELVFLTVSSTTLCGFGAGSSMLEIRDTLNTKVLIKGGLAMLRIVNCALDAVSISGCISLFVVVNSQGFVSLFSLMVVEFRGLLYETRKTIISQRSRISARANGK
ncbi:hypothetical protein YC2023_077369 [Brassica napus]